MKPRKQWGPADELANGVMVGIVLMTGVALVILVLAALDSYGLLPWARHRVVSEAREMTREDVVCDWPRRTISIKPSTYSSVVSAVTLCGWDLKDGNIFIDAQGPTTFRGAPMVYPPVQDCYVMGGCLLPKAEIDKWFEDAYRRDRK